MAGAVGARTRLTNGERRLVSIGWWSLLILFSSVSLFLLLRRFTGALVQPLNGVGLIAASVILATIVAVLRQQVPSSEYLVPCTQYLVDRPRYKQLLLGGLGGIALPTLCVVTLPGTPAWAVAIAWLILLAAEIAYWRSPLDEYVRRRRRVVPLVQPTTSQNETEDELPPGLVQRLTRVRENDRESIHALAPAEIPAGDRLAAVHLAFCPPLESVPELTAHALDNEEAEVRITQIESFGARIEVRLRGITASARSVLVEVLGSATCRPVL